MLCHDVLAMCLLLAARLRAVMSARSRSPCTPLLFINQPLVCTPALIQPLRACDRSRSSRSLLSLLYMSICLVLACVYACVRHALRAATESKTSNFDHEQIGTMGWQCPECNIQVERGSKDTSQCAVSHNYLRTRAILTLCKILHSSHCTVFFGVCVRF